MSSRLPLDSNRQASIVASPARPVNANRVPLRFVPTDASFFGEIVFGYRAAKTLFVAHDLGLFELLAESPCSSTGAAERLGTNPRTTHILLCALTALGLVAH